MESYDSTAVATADAADSIEELAAFLELKLLHRVDYDQLRQLFRAQCELRDHKKELESALKNGKLSKEHYFAQLNDEFGAFMHASISVLGKEQFIRAYGEEPWDIRGIINPEIFFGDHKPAFS